MALSTPMEQFADVSPPRAGKLMAITLSPTARSYALSALAMAGFTPVTDATQRATQPTEVFLCLQALTADCFYSFSSTAQTLTGTASVIDGGTPAFSNTDGAVLPAGGQPVRLRIDRSIDNFLNVKGSAAGTLVVWVGSRRT